MYLQKVTLYINDNIDDSHQYVDSSHVFYYNHSLNMYLQKVTLYINDNIDDSHQYVDS
jgi:hypothetical protein